MTEPFFLSFLKALVVFAIALGAVPALVLAERRVSAFMQYRVGPNRVGPLGTLQPLADLIKMIFKEEVRPDGASPWIFSAAPAITAICALATAAIVPFGGVLVVGERRIPLIVADVEIGVLVALAMSSMAVYGLTLGGWSSNSKYSLLGGLRSSAQMISYELTLGLSLISVLLLSRDPEGFGSFGLRSAVETQAQGGLLSWNVFKAPISFLLFTIASFAETHRLPFDLPEAEPELVGGYHTEYSAMRFGLFFLGEYAAMFVSSCIIVCLFLGGWHLPFVADEVEVDGFGALLQLGSFLLKVGAVTFFFIHVRWTLPRFRYDQLMSLGWKVLLPVALLNLLVMGSLVALKVF